MAGPIIDRECRLELIVKTPPSVLPERERRVSAIVDTGCTITAVRPDIATDLGLPVVSTVKVSTASTGTDPVECDVVLARLTLVTGGKSASSYMQLAVAEMASEMLFGMDAMEGGCLSVDFVRRRWEWRLMKVL